MTRDQESTAVRTTVPNNDWSDVPWLKLLVPYVLAFGLVLFFMDAIYWDDWVLFNTDDQAILKEFSDVGVIFNWAGYFHVAMLKIGPHLYRVMTLLLGYLCGVLLWKLLGTFREISSEQKFWIALLFLVSPFNPAKFSLINVPSILCLFTFFLAWYLLVAKCGVFFRSLSLAFFLFSFNINSLLVFYLLPVTHAVWLYSEHKWIYVIRWGARNVLFILAPVFFFWFKTRFFPPSGLYVGYNSISLILTLKALLPLPVMALGFYWTGKQLKAGWRVQHWFPFVVFGLLVLWLAVFPYLAVGKVPSFNDWDSRYQLLMPLGSALLIVGTGLLFGNFRRFCYVATVISVICCAYFMSVLLLDWWKQEEVIALLKRSEAVKAARTIVMVDEAKSINAFNRTYRFYEYNAWFKKMFGDETRFAANGFDLDSHTPMRIPARYRPYCTPCYSAGNYKWSVPDLLVTIRSSGISSFVRGNGLVTIATEKILSP